MPQLRCGADNLWAAVGLDGTFVEQRWRLAPDAGNYTAPPPSPQACSLFR